WRQHPWRRHEMTRRSPETRRTKRMGCRGNRPSMRATLICALSLAATLACDSIVATARAAEGDQTPLVPSAIPSVAPKTRFLALGVGKSVIIDLPRDAKDVLVADPKIANAVIRSPQRAYIIGSGVGQTNVVFFDGEGQQIASYDIAIKR